MQLAALPNLVSFDGELYYRPGFYGPEQADAYYQNLYRDVPWQQERLYLYGRWVNVPRLITWFGDPAAQYRYSGVEHQPLPWTADLQALRGEVEGFCNAAFNSVLANLYRDGRDSMGCHADDEKELGQNPLIASLSFGDSRLLRFKHRKSGQKLEIELKHGDLLVMAGELQHHWRHELPKTRKSKQLRVNLTFRRIIDTEESVRFI